MRIKALIRLVFKCCLISCVILGSAHAGLKSIRIVLDPGHGGKDPGTVSLSGIKEKKITLTVAKQTAHLINLIPGFSTKLTRTADYYVSLRGRIAIARKFKANAFIAIHADALKNRNVSGASVYVLSQKGVHREQNIWLLKQDNRDTFQSGFDLDHYSSKTGKMIYTHMQSATLASSLLLGTQILNQFKSITRLLSPKPKRANFLVLRAPDIPSVLVELGFLSNNSEAKRLSQKSYQHKLAVVLTLGILNYFKQHPPKGTLAYKYGVPKYIYYKIKRGDTLSELAAKFDFKSYKALQSAARLKSSVLHVGQKIKIPLSKILNI